ncbi:SUMO protease ULP1 [Aspergillus stella-maris]|uniref:SUMO protease ULP1 n=1 Tax=Aspergillus stella-maris TaxID=1810926 RepID=UPI003CCDB39B
MSETRPDTQSVSGDLVKFAKETMVERNVESSGNVKKIAFPKWNEAITSAIQPVGLDKAFQFSRPPRAANFSRKRGLDHGATTEAIIKYRRLNEQRARVPAQRDEATMAEVADDKPISFYRYLYFLFHMSIDHIVTFAGTAAQRALALFRPRQTRINTRSLNHEDFQKLKINKWRKDHGREVLEKFPFPDLRKAFDSPEIQELPSSSLTLYRPQSPRSPAAVTGPPADPSPLVPIEPVMATEPVVAMPSEPVTAIESAIPIEPGLSIDPAAAPGPFVRSGPLVLRSSAGCAGPSSAAPNQQSWIDSCDGFMPMGPHMSAVSYVRGDQVAPGRLPSMWQCDRAVTVKIALGPNGRVLLEMPAVRPISEAQLVHLQISLCAKKNKLITHTTSGDPLHRDDLATCFKPQAWLNDEMMNAYMPLIVNFLRDRHDNTGRRDKPLFHAFNSFFFSNLRDKGVESVQRWATRAKIGGANLLKAELVFIPVHNNSHWTMMIVSPRARTIEHYDSLGKGSKQFVSKVKGWVEKELGPSLYVEDEWKTPIVQSPQQDNGSDCGVFALTTAKAIGLGIDPASFGPPDIPTLRAKIVSEIVQGQILGDGDHL